MFAPLEIQGKFAHEAVDRVHIGVLIGQALLDGAMPFGHAGQLRNGVLQVFQWKAPRPDGFRAEVAVEVGPSGPLHAGGLVRFLPRLPEFRSWEIVIVRFKDHLRAIADRMQVSQVLPPIMPFGQQAGELEGHGALPLEAPEVASLQAEIERRRLIADQDEIESTWLASGCEGAKHGVGCGDGGDDECGPHTRGALNRILRLK